MFRDRISHPRRTTGKDYSHVLRKHSDVLFVDALASLGGSGASELARLAVRLTLPFGNRHWHVWRNRPPHPPLPEPVYGRPCTAESPMSCRMK